MAATISQLSLNSTRQVPRLHQGAPVRVLEPRCTVIVGEASEPRQRGPAPHSAAAKPSHNVPGSGLEQTLGGDFSRMRCAIVLGGTRHGADPFWGRGVPAKFSRFGMGLTVRIAGPQQDFNRQNNAIA